MRLQITLLPGHSRAVVLDWAESRGLTYTQSETTIIIDGVEEYASLIAIHAPAEYLEI